MAKHRNGRNFSLRKFLAGALIAGVGGAVAGILLAPQPGGETRQELKKGAYDFKAKAGEAISVVQQHGTAALDGINDHAMNIKNEVKQAVDVAIEEGKAVAKETKNIARKGTQDTKEDLEGAMETL